MTRKYSRINQSFYLSDGRRVVRIIALRDFRNVRSGTIGGFIEHDENLSHDGDCWVADNAIAAGQSRVTQNAILRDRAMIDDYVAVSGSAIIQDDAFLYKNVFVYENANVGLKSYLTDAATVSGNSKIFCNYRYNKSGHVRLPNVSGIVEVRDCARLEGTISINERCIIAGNSIVRGNVKLNGCVRVDGNAIVENHTFLGDDVWITQYAKVGGRSKISGRCIVHGHSKIHGNTILLCNVQIGGIANVENKIFSGDTVVMQN
jgi:UDP-3-O-[3-hydroxymyristoyl] glucosamine N-acyltransferase